MTIRRWVSSAVFLCSLLVGGPLFAQGIFATLTGVVSDPSGGVVPNARITLTDAVSGSTRDTVTNGDGYYTFASVPVGTYDLTVDGKGFRLYKASAISLGGGERRNINVSLVVGSTAETVQVNAENTALAITDSGEKSFSLQTKELENFTQVGSNAAEYIKIVPGLRHTKWHAKQIELQRPDDRNQCQWRLWKPKPAERRVFL